VIVADASTIVEVLFRSEAGLRAERRLLRRGETIHAPALIDVDVAQVLRRYVLRGDLTPIWARTAIGLLGGFPMERYGHEPLLARMWELRDNLTAYDAAYVALAEGLRAPLVTCDKRLANATGIRASIELIQ
jgi:predicted nucleic acid-binding protein